MSKEEQTFFGMIFLLVRAVAVVVVFLIFALSEQR